MVSIYAVRERTTGLFNVKNLTLSTLELVYEVHTLAVNMGGFGVGEVGTGASTQVDGMLNGTSLTPRPIAGLEVSGGGRIMEVEIGVNMSCDQSLSQ